MPTTTNHPSGLPEQEPTSPTAVVLCGGEAWAKTGADWEARTQWLGAWGNLRVFAAEKGGATLLDLADLPTGLTEAQKEAVRSIESKFLTRGGLATEIRNALPEAFADDLVTAKWKSSDSDEKWADLLRVACMDGASVVATRCGATRSGNVHHVERSIRIHLGLISGEVVIDLLLGGWTITVTAPKPADPGADIPDEVVDEALDSFMNALAGHERPKGLKVRNFMRAALAAADAKRAELMGGEQA